MADEKTTKGRTSGDAGAEQSAQRPPESSASVDADRRKVDSADEVRLPKQRIGAPENALIGDENQPEPRKVTAEVVSEDQPAQVHPGKPNESDTVPVHETYVQMDEVVLDPSSPEAVQIPDAGMGYLDLPIHGLASPTVEEQFADGVNDEEARRVPGTASDENTQS